MSGPDEGNKFYLRGPMVECVLGRSRESDLVVNDPNASRRHGLVKKDYNGIFYQCLGAKNLAQINGKDVPRNGTKRLRDRDEIQIGSVRILFIDPDAELLQSLSEIPGFEDSEPVSQAVQEEAQGEGDGEAAAEDSQAAEAPAEESIAEPPPAEESVAEAPPAEAPSEQPAEGQPDLPAPGTEEPGLQTGAERHGGMTTTQIAVLAIAGVAILLGVMVLIMLL
jgi:predicted component of type VI protein secretion system